MSVPNKIAGILCSALSCLAFSTQANEPRNCYVEAGEIICQTVTDPFSNLAPAAKAQVVYRELDERNGATMGFGGQGYVDGESTLIATITTDGKTIKRQMKMRFLERDNDQDKRIIVIHNPKDTKGTALLTVSNQNGLDDQWIYSPTNKQVKRIARNNSATSFAGTEIFFEDLSLQSLNKYDFEYLRKETVSGREIHVIARFPKDQYSAYSKLVTWVDAQHYYPIKVVYYDKKKLLMKTLTASKYKKYNDKFWRAGSMSIVNHQNNNETRLDWSDYRFNIGLSEQSFSLNSLQRARNL
ncbi:MAG: outer membrane lipoprotein-sorting protein [Pseudomonadales bacterium]|nr:outer membrane lipoprotein-sorting protein [Pseudomonadales bacterium]